MEASRSSGDINSVNTMEAMNEKIMVMDMARAEIRTVDSLDGGVTMLVTGHLTGGDSVLHEFSRSFLLAPQEKGYFVLNDMFRYNGEDPAPAAAEVHPEADVVVVWCCASTRAACCRPYTGAAKGGGCLEPATRGCTRGCCG